MSLLKEQIQDWAGINEEKILADGKVVGNKVNWKKISPKEKELLNYVDPTGRNKYARWILLTKEGLNDLARRKDEYKEYLKKFNDLLERNQLKKEDRDIYKYKSWEDLFDKMITYKTDEEKEEEWTEEITPEIEKDAEIWVKNKNIEIRILKGYDACRIFSGKNPKWCISQKTRGYWDSYSRQLDVFYIIRNLREDKGLHIDSDDLPATDSRVMLEVKMNYSGNKKGELIFWNTKDVPLQGEQLEKYIAWLKKNGVTGLEKFKIKGIDVHGRWTT